MDPDIRPTKRPKTKIADFETPEAVAAKQPLQAMRDTDQPIFSDTFSQPNGSSSNWRQKLTSHWPLQRREWLTTVVIVLIGGFGIFAVLSHHGAKPVASAVVPKPPPAKVVAKPTIVPSTLSGLPVDPAVNARPVTGVMIENSLAARPQSGLGQASVVFEAIAEGGITRFLALFQDTIPTDVGPIRSARPYYVEWALGFDAGYAHVGGSPEALAAIKTWGARDLDQFANSGSYHRITSREAPHNVYTGVNILNQLEAAKGYTSSTFTGFPRKKAAPAKQPTARTIDVSISGPSYSSHYDYVAATNTYNRSEAGSPHIDAATNTQISPSVVITMVMPYSLESDGYHSAYQTIGSGPATVFQNGTATPANWNKSSDKNQFVFTDAAGKVIGLNPGQTWLTAVGKPSAVTFAP